VSKRLSCLLALAAAALFWVSIQPEPARVATQAVLGSAWTLSDLVSGTYARPREAVRRKAKVQRVADTRKRARKARKAETRLARSRMKRPPMRNLASGYRTLCVRLCDGYYFPISAAATPGEFQRDEAKCQSSCSSPAKLFVYGNKGGSPETMTDLEGMPYGTLANAFQYRVSYEASCTCSPAPWTEEAANRHRLYALNEAAAAGDHAAEIARIPVAAAVEAGERAARARTGADLVVASVPQMKAIADARRGGVTRRVAERTPVATRKARVIRTAAAQPARPRVLRSGTAFPAPRTVRVVQRARPVRFSETRGLIYVMR
jgi:hypothetical protein